MRASGDDVERDGSFLFNLLLGAITAALILAAIWYLDMHIP